MGTSHTHVHTTGEQATAASRASTITLGAIAVALLLATIVGVVALWPSASQVPRAQLLAPGVELLEATVDDVPTDPQSAIVTATGVSDPIAGESIQVQVTADVLSGMRAGDRIRVLSFTGAADPGAADPGAVDVGAADPAATDAPTAQAPTGQTYAYFDHERKLPLGILFLLYLLVVALVARGRGLRAVLGLSAGVAVVAWFLVPALLSGANPTLVALVAAGAMIFPSVYVAHGISIRTTTAVIGTCAGIGFTLLLALLASGPAGMTGADDENAQHLFTTQPGISLSGLFLTGVIISSLGALNDVTITQASATWELRAAMPGESRWKVFAAAMRIGRDHIASTVYTLAYAYIGSALPILLVAATIDRGFLDTITSGEIGAEVFRTLVASIGLVLAIPLTTGIAAMLASTVERRPRFDADRAVW
jgi:uncharacterized membrane protein